MDLHLRACVMGGISPPRLCTDKFMDDGGKRKEKGGLELLALRRIATLQPFNWCFSPVFVALLNTRCSLALCKTSHGSYVRTKVLKPSDLKQGLRVRGHAFRCDVLKTMTFLILGVKKGS
ncbi:hypothetical protein RRG08_006836 [Elysia crispata]|uniref:Uncharacterized protein n=1 Tax=Elysia crispata TaxID=231223 RepID=A0AAE0XVQ5_9GAST|nr:hypothetical protein RRG08_006836 [Elysia crispata]